jgi:hypothetical protein
MKSSRFLVVVPTIIVVSGLLLDVIVRKAKVLIRNDWGIFFNFEVRQTFSSQCWKVSNKLSLLPISTYANNNPILILSFYNADYRAHDRHLKKHYDCLNWDILICKEKIVGSSFRLADHFLQLNRSLWSPNKYIIILSVLPIWDGQIDDQNFQMGILKVVGEELITAQNSVTSNADWNTVTRSWLGKHSTTSSMELGGNTGNNIFFDRNKRRSSCVLDWSSMH